MLSTSEVNQTVGILDPPMGSVPVFKGFWDEWFHLILGDLCVRGGHGSVLSEPWGNRNAIVTLIVPLVVSNKGGDTAHLTRAITGCRYSAIAASVILDLYRKQRIRPIRVFMSVMYV